MKKIFNNIKQFIKKISNKEYIKEHINYVVLGILILVFLVSTLVYFLVTRSVSDIEKNKIIKETTPFVNYINEIENTDSDSNDKFILFALKYHYYQEDKNTLTSTEISDFINDIFDIEMNPKDVKNIGVSPIMAESGVIYNSDNDSYTISIDNTNKRELETKSVIYYKIDSISKSSKSKYKVKYTKYLIENPLELFNYILEYNIDKKEEDMIDVSYLKEYLQTGDYNKIMYFLNNSDFDLSKCAKKLDTVYITYTIGDNDKLKIYEIK
ncbi:MAG: hypothetical protein IKF36_03990 [Bacilli bacterium]|nr:hypothetical protein [Bacilli bacterium]